MQTVLSVDLGPSNAAKAIGYRVLTLAGSTYAAFTTTNVIESTVTPGKYIVTAAVTVPDTGCRVVFGESGDDIDEFTLDGQASVDLSSVTTQLTTIDDFLDTEIAAIKAKTDNLPSDPADQSLVEAAISTIAATVAASNPAGVDAGQIAMRRSVTFDGTLTGVSIIPVAWESAKFTIKRRIGEADSDAMLQIKVTNGGDAGDGLKILKGSTWVTSANDASLTVNQGAGTVSIHIEDDALAAIATGAYWYDVKFYYGTSDSVATAPARCVVSGVVTESV